MIFNKCPWCNKEFTSNKYPRSAGLSELRDREREHMRNNHPQYIKNMKRLLKYGIQKF
jgi:hypothetical protein